jgi:fibronectin type 3 domain-containing protein
MHVLSIIASCLVLLLTGCGVSNQSSSTAAEKHTVALTWNSTSSTITGYNVYRGVDRGGPYSRIASLLPTNSYTDNWVSSGQTYFYVVTAVGLNSVESGYSNEVFASIP